MECWNEGCKNKVKVFCRCKEPPICSCPIHVYDHIRADSIVHYTESLKLKLDPKNKGALIEEVQKLSKELTNIKASVIKDTSKKIQELKLLLRKTLENIQKVKTNQANLIEQIYSIKKIHKINQNPIEKLLSLDLDSARKKLDEFGCVFNGSVIDFNQNVKIDTFETNEIVFFETGTKNSIRVNLNNISKSVQQVDIFQSNIDIPNYISMCLLPDNSIFCYGNYPGTETAFILYPNGTIKQLSDGDPSGNMGAVHHDGFIYLFGGCNSAGQPWNQAAKYELSTDKWYKISPLKTNLSQVSCLAGIYGILFVGYQSSKLYSYYHDQDIYNEFNPNFAENTFKVLLQAENRVFLIESSKNIYENEQNQLSNWKIIGTTEISCSGRVGYQVYFNHNCYFTGDNGKIYKFDMSNLQLTMEQV